MAHLMMVMAVCPYQIINQQTIGILFDEWVAGVDGDGGDGG